jgi:hypothetical protein
MSNSLDTGAVTTVSGMIGGIVKAVSVKPVMMAITFGSLANVMVYAAASAGVGYVVKKVLDKLKSHGTFNKEAAGHIDVAVRPNGKIYVWDGFRRTFMAGIVGL